MGNLVYATRVGIVVFLGLLLFGGVVFILKDGVFGNTTYTIHVLFDDASGAAPGVDVTMSGVKIGEVKKITLTKGLRADMILSIKNDRKIPVGSRFIIVVPALGDVGVVTVVPPAHVPPRPTASIQPGAIVDHGEQEPDINSAMNNANELMGEFRVTVVKVNRLLDQSSSLIGDPSMQKALHESLTNMQMASRNGVELTNDMNRALAADNSQVQGLLYQTQRGEQTALSNVTATTADIRSITHDNKANLNEIIENLRDTTAAVEGITDQTNQMLKSGGVTQNLSAIVANMNQTSQKLNAIAGNLQQLTSDKDMQGDLKATVHNLAVTTEQMSYTVERVNHLIGVKEKGATTVSTPSKPASTTAPPGQAPLILPRVEMYDNTRDHRFQANVDAIVPIGKGPNFGQIGIFDATNANRLNLEYGTLAPAGSLLDYRVGLHSSQLGLGADWGLGRSQSISADLYDPNYTHLDVHGTWMLNPNIGLLIGGDDLTKRSTAVVGVELRH